MGRQYFLYGQFIFWCFSVPQQDEMEANPCTPNPCQNGGTCHAFYNGDYHYYSCICPTGFEGTHCQGEACFIVLNHLFFYLFYFTLLVKKVVLKRVRLIFNQFKFQIVRSCIDTEKREEMCKKKASDLSKLILTIFFTTFWANFQI